MPNKPDCYECRWKGVVPGDAHIKCCHPYNEPLLNHPIFELVGMLPGRVTLPLMFDKRLNISANEHGIRHGWFNYPFSFDPVWLLSCEGFEKLEVDSAKARN